MPDDRGRYNAYRMSSDFINIYIFPGGCLPSLGALAEASAKTSLVLEAARNIGLHYAPTLAIWRARFLDQQRRLAELGFDEVFVRRWALYFSYCEAGFASRMIGDHILLYSRPGCSTSLPQLPLVDIDGAAAELGSAD